MSSSHQSWKCANSAPPNSSEANPSSRPGQARSSTPSSRSRALNCLRSMFMRRRDAGRATETYTTGLRSRGCRGRSAESGALVERRDSTPAPSPGRRRKKAGHRPKGRRTTGAVASRCRGHASRVDSDHPKIVVRSCRLALGGNLIVDRHAVTQSGNSALEAIPFFRQIFWPFGVRSCIAHRCSMNSSGASGHNDRHLESDACSHQQREELRHAFSVALTGLQQESGDRILCESRGQDSPRLRRDRNGMRW